MSNPYRSAILDHSRAPHRRGVLLQPTHCGCGENALCGDSLSVQLRVAEGRILDYAFEAEACAIVVATASMLGEALVGHAPTRLEAIEADLRRLLGQTQPEPDGALAVRLGALADLAEMRALPRRHRCVMLALEAVRAALMAPSAANNAE
ncbi:iron-sulfur cluster assembly scaffold protein [Aquimonas voraii]|uniref:Nitrogen fixation protein NifU n=1 Tax=Aquimonas voraii TaxID=265719 RepID=A0A1G6TV87_9GAMM|nr:iron-sulfur cluster assembly scaffold protein [Aquimonas voraii]SDD32951.1 nitrogen fixation protein NifU [Aquimonas voraii]